MKNQISLNIKTPCSENFDQFSPTPNGGFCGSCKHEVIDFTQMNAQQIIHHFEKRDTKNTCGRFKSTQLQQIPKRKKLGFWSGIGLACLSFFSFHVTQAQDVIKPLESSDNNPNDIQASQFEKNIIVKGKVTDQSLPLPGATIMLEGTTIGASTNFDGDFEFPEKLKKGDVLIFSYVGYTSQKVIITNQDSASNIALEIDMKACDVIFMGKVAVKQVYKSKRD